MASAEPSEAPELDSHEPDEEEVVLDPLQAPDVEVVLLP
jgi:hypothetical protein